MLYVLDDFLEKHESGQISVHHPLYTFPLGFIDVPEERKKLESLLALAESSVMNAASAEEFVLLHTRPYRVHALLGNLL